MEAFVFGALGGAVGGLVTGFLFVFWASNLPDEPPR